MYEGDSYCWIVICKNKRFHRRQNQYYGHRIPLAPTDMFEPPPPLRDKFNVRCDECGAEYSYKPAELMRFEMEMPESVAPHPLFQ